MPQASLREHRWAQDRFGGIEDAPVVEWLEARGWTLTRHFHWKLPMGRDRPTKEELRAIRFLIAEWDYGGISR